MNIIEQILQQLDENERQQDFYKATLFIQVSKIQYHFKGNVSQFFDVPIQFARFLRKEHPSDAQIKWIYSHLKWYNSVGIDRDQLRSIFGRAPGSRRALNYNLEIQNLEAKNLIKVIQHGTVTMINSDGSSKKVAYPNKYLIPQTVLKQVFEDHKLVETILDLTSSWYSKRLRTVMFSQFLTKSEDEADKKLDDLPFATATDTSSEVNAVEFVRSKIITSFSSGKLILDHAQVLYRMIDKDHILPILKANIKIAPDSELLSSLIQMVDWFKRNGKLATFDSHDEIALKQLKSLVALCSRI